MKSSMKAAALSVTIAMSAAACDESTTGPAQTEASFVKGGQPQPSLPTIVDIVVAEDGEFDALQTVVVRSGLAGVLAGNRPFTVFAPTDAAFGDLFTALGVPGDSPEEQADNACPEASGCPEFVRTTVLYHVVSGRRYSQSVLGARQLTTLAGDRLLPDGASLNTSCPNSAAIMTASPGHTFDIPASNGVIHVIDAVLLPKAVCDLL